MIVQNEIKALGKLVNKTDYWTVWDNYDEGRILAQNKK